MRESILNRLQGGSAGEASPEKILDNLREDLQQLLNTRNSFRPDLAEVYPEAAVSVLAYGLPDSEDPWFSQVHSLEQLRRRVQETIVAFEPRVKNVEVRVVESPTSRSTQTVVLEIRGEIRVGTQDEKVIWNSILREGMIEISAT